jgi:GT2 family glycosyltransferase
MPNKKIKTEKQQADFFEQAYSQTLKAIPESARCVYDIQLADTTIRLLFPNHAFLELLTPALQHLHVTQVNNKDSIDAYFYIWDSESTGLDMPMPSCTKADYTDRGDIWGFDSKRYQLAFHWSDFSVNLFDLKKNIGIFWVQNSNSLPYWSKASPLRTLFHWWMKKNQAQLLHAAAIGTEKGAVLVTGKGGIGKSSTALAGLATGLQYIGDDYVIVKLTPHPRVFSLYSSAKLNPDQTNQFPQLALQLTHIEEDEKTSFYLYPVFSQQISLSLPIVAILTPEFSAQSQTIFSPVSKELLQGAASLTTMSQLPHSNQITYELIGDLIDQCPTMKIQLGSDLHGVANAIKNLIEQPQTIHSPSIAPNNSISLPLISVIIPIYNGAEFLAEAIDNILSQQYPSLEIIIIDDGSTDNIDQVVAGLSVDVRYLKRENKGPATARNIGIKDASSEFIAFLDVDDLWPKNTLLTLLTVLQEQPELDLVHGHAQLMRLDDKTKQYNFIGNPLESFKYYIGAGLYRASVFETVGLFDTDLRFAEDIDWYNRTNELGVNRQRLELVTLWVRRHGKNMTEGKTLLELSPLKAFKKTLDRQRLNNKIN